MPIEEAIFTRGSTHAGMTGLIGAGNDCRFYPGRVPPEAVLPAASYQRIPGADEEPQAMGVGAGVTTARYQITAWAATYQMARDLADQIRAAFARWRGVVAGVTIQDSLPVLTNEEDEPDAGTFWRSRDFLISFLEA